MDNPDYDIEYVDAEICYGCGEEAFSDEVEDVDGLRLCPDCADDLDPDSAPARGIIRYMISRLSS